MIERDVKDAVKAIILEMSPTSHTFMPVQTGYGQTDLDFIVTINGFSLRIETKVNGKQPSARQWTQIWKITKSGCVVLVIDQNNIADVCEVVSLLLRGQQAEAVYFADWSRVEYAD